MTSHAIGSHPLEFTVSSMMATASIGTTLDPKVMHKLNDLGSGHMTQALQLHYHVV